MNNIDLDIGFGALGSVPEQLGRDFNIYMIDYVAYGDFNSLKEAADAMTSCTIVFVSQNDEEIVGIHSKHAFMIEKDNGQYKSYNGYEIINNGSSNLSDAIQYKFDYAYIVG